MAEFTQVYARSHGSRIAEGVPEEKHGGMPDAKGQAPKPPSGATPHSA